jgi:hypothetical protein
MDGFSIFLSLAVSMLCFIAAWAVNRITKLEQNVLSLTDLSCRLTDAVCSLKNDGFRVVIEHIEGHESEDVSTDQIEGMTSTQIGKLH